MGPPSNLQAPLIRNTNVFRALLNTLVADDPLYIVPFPLRRSPRLHNEQPFHVTIVVPSNVVPHLFLHTLLQRLQQEKPFIEIEEIHTFAKLYLREMMNAKDSILEKKQYTQEEVATMLGDALNAIHWCGLFQLIHNAVYVAATNDVQEALIFSGNNPLTLSSKPAYQWLMQALLEIKKELMAMTDDEREILKELLLKKKEPVTSEKIMSAFRKITALQLKLDRHIVTPSAKLEGDKKINWQEAFTVADTPEEVVSTPL